MTLQQTLQKKLTLYLYKMYSISTFIPHGGEDHVFHAYVIFNVVRIMY